MLAKDHETRIRFIRSRIPGQHSSNYDCCGKTVTVLRKFLIPKAAHMVETFDQRQQSNIIAVYADMPKVSHSETNLPIYIKSMKITLCIES